MVGHVARVKKNKNAYSVGGRSDLNGRNHLEDLVLKM
jgi:hypothetical protein